MKKVGYVMRRNAPLRQIQNNFIILKALLRAAILK